ncbi:hypothetical protein [Vibrio parahaemolyticus]|uniref:hypothetical protein n=1 Tax=Vibrio parahaemolyticus TaxID=670 RepID=UPI002269AA9D|nr:hypothetical protein [Vibrio parahaemolyticus]MCX8904531.1 hypothetical protein [Vibrio parahaemolyticus]
MRKLKISTTSNDCQRLIDNCIKCGDTLLLSFFIDKVTPTSILEFIDNFYFSESSDKCYMTSYSRNLYALSPCEVYFKFDEYYLDIVNFEHLFSSSNDFEDDYLFDYILQNQIAIEFDNLETNLMRGKIHGNS